MLFRFVFVVVTAFIAVHPLAHAEEPAPTMLVIDGSGSMWGRLEDDKGAKIDIVRELILPHIDAAKDLPIGLTSFGHRRRSNCSDVEVISSPVTDHMEEIEAIQKLNPRGKGPLVSALHAAVAAIGPARPANMVVINDGPDNCRQDTCAAAENIAKEFPGIAIHMISIGIDPNDAPHLTCIATATGGTFHDVQDTAGLASALDEVAKIALRAPGSAAPETPPPIPDVSEPATTAAGLQATASLADGGPAINIPVHWRIMKKGDAGVLAESDGAIVKARLDPGTYVVEASYGALSVQREVEVSAGNTAGIIVPLGVARLTVTSKGERSATTSSMVIVTIDPAPGIENQRPVLARKLGVPEYLRPGTYTITVVDGTVRRSKPVSLKAGDDATLEFALGAGRIELSAGLRPDGGAIDDVVFSLSEDDPYSPNGRREIARSRAPQPSFTVPAGTYYASARSGEGEVHERIAVSAGDVVKRDLILPLVAVTVSAMIGNEPVTRSEGITYRVTALDGNRGEILRSVKPGITLSLVPGRYRIAAHLDAHHLKVAKEVTVENGKSDNVVLTFNAGEVDLKPGAGAIRTNGDTYWEITDSAGKPVWRALTTDAHALLAPGRYTVRLDNRDKTASAAFEVQAGERKVVEVDLN